jgi:hypothetical protein
LPIGQVQFVGTTPTPTNNGILLFFGFGIEFFKCLGLSLLLSTTSDTKLSSDGLQERGLK